MTTLDTQLIYLNIADLVVALATRDELTAARIEKRYQAFLAAPADPALSVTIEIVPGAVFIDPTVSRTWVIESSFANNRLTYRSYGDKAEVDLTTGRGTLILNPSVSVENFLRVAYAWLCLSHDAILLHAAGVVRDGQGYVFFGPSGAGKTTTSRLAGNVADVLSDDLVIIRRRGDGYYLFGVPFKGELSDAPRSNQVAPLRGIFRLRQDRHHRVAPMAKAVATAEMAAAAPFVTSDPQLGEVLVDRCRRVADEVPVNALHFRRDPGYWKVIDGFFADVSTAAPANGR